LGAVDVRRVFLGHRPVGLGQLEMSLSAGAPRVAIVGAGIAGLTLGGLLSRKLPNLQLKIFERADSNRDEGYGLDLDEHGQEALVRAGLFHKFWSVSRPNSNVWTTYPLRGEEPLFCRVSSKMFAESNRAELRNLYLDALKERGHEVQYNCAVDAVHANGRGVELVSRDGTSMGDFSLAFDAGGLYSPLRKLRVSDDRGVHYVGSTMIHGVLENPEETASAELLKKLNEGTCAALGRGYFLILQRFGSSFGDKRTAFFYWIRTPGEDGLLEDAIGIKRATSRTEAMRGAGEDLAKVKAFLHKDMGDHFDPVWHNAIDCITRATVRGDYSHGAGTVLRQDAESVALPLVCCGDSLRNIGLGGGGNLAIEDALGYTKVLSSRHGFCEETGRLDEEALQGLRRAEAAALKRKQKHFSSREKTQTALYERDGGDPLASKLSDMADRWHYKLGLGVVGTALKSMHSFQAWLGGGAPRGSGPDSPLHAQVAKALQEEGLER